MGAFKVKSIRLETHRKKPRLCFRMADGSRFYETLNLSAEEALKVHQVLEGQRITGQLNIEHFFRSSITLGDLRDRYFSHRLDQVGFGHIKKETHGWEVHGINLFISVIGASRPLHTIDKITFSGFVKSLQGTRNKYGDLFKPTTINDYRKAIAGMFSWALDQGLVDNNPVASFKPLRIRSHRRSLSSAELFALSEHLKNKSAWQLDAFLLALNTGIRVGVIPQLKSSDLSTRSVSGKSIYVLSFVTKNDKAQTIPCNKIVVDIILKRISLLQDSAFTENLLPQYQSRARDHYIFFDVIDKRSISKSFTRACRTLGIQGVCFHSLRHTFISNLKTAGVPTAIVSHLAGHSDTNTTDIYTHIDLSYFAEHPELFAPNSDQ
jgi:integrase